MPFFATIMPFSHAAAFVRHYTPHVFFAAIRAMRDMHELPLTLLRARCDERRARVMRAALRRGALMQMFAAIEASCANILRTRIDARDSRLRMPRVRGM